MGAPQEGVPKFVYGPLVITGLDERAVVRITKGHPADAEGDSPTVAVLDCKTFRGQFEVDWDSLDEASLAAAMIALPTLGFAVTRSSARLS